jgi:hypothetical protein
MHPLSGAKMPMKLLGSSYLLVYLPETKTDMMEETRK